jgi:multimeric flavodoxin WrbA
MVRISAIYGSPRRDGNTAALLKQAVAGARDQGATVEEIILRDYTISPCLEIYQCIKSGECAIRDDFPALLDILESSDGIMLASPIFFYTVSAHTKIFMDRCQSRWVRKYWIDKKQFGQETERRKGLFISVGATHGEKLFDGALLTVRYFFDVLDASLWKKLLFRGLDFRGEAEKNEDYLVQAYVAGQEMVLLLAQEQDVRAS